MDCHRVIPTLVLLLVLISANGCMSTKSAPRSSSSDTKTEKTSNPQNIVNTVKVVRRNVEREHGTIAAGIMSVASVLLGDKSRRDPPYSDYQVGTVLISSNTVENDGMLALSPYFLYLVITEVNDNRNKIERAVMSFRENFESYDYVYVIESDPAKIIPFVAPVESIERPLSIENYSVTMARQLKRQYQQSVPHASTSIAIYGSPRELLSASTEAPDDITVIDLEPYTPDEIANVINKIRHEMSIVKAQDSWGLFASAQASQTGLSDTGETVGAAEHKERLSAVRESEISLIARQVFNAIGNWLAGD